MLSEIIAHSRDFAWIPFLLVFLALPFGYCLLAIDVHREYAELYKSAPDGYQFDDGTRESISRDLHVFELDWWLIVSVAMLFVGLFALDGLVTKSNSLGVLPSDLSSQPMAVASVVAPAASGPHAAAGCGANDTSKAACAELAFVRSALIAYATGVAIAISFMVLWGRVSAVRRLAAYYAHLRSTAKPKT